MKISSFAVDEKKTIEGVWHEIGDNASVLIARAGNDKYRKDLRAMMKPYKRRLEREDPGMDKIAEGLLNKCMARHILLDWQGVEDDDGNEIPYSTEQALDNFEKYPEFRDLISDLSNDTEAYKVQEEEEITKN
jgi:hypothetical protein